MQAACPCFVRRNNTRRRGLGGPSFETSNRAGGGRPRCGGSASRRRRNVTQKRPGTSTKSGCDAPPVSSRGDAVREFPVRRVGRGQPSRGGGRRTQRTNKRSARRRRRCLFVDATLWRLVQRRGPPPPRSPSGRGLGHLPPPPANAE